MHLEYKNCYLQPKKNQTSLIGVVLIIRFITSKKILVIRLFISSLFCAETVKLFNFSENFPAITPIRAVKVVVNLQKQLLKMNL